MLFPSAGKYKNSKNNPCPTFADIRLIIRALVTLNLRRTHIPDEQKANLERICQSKNIDILL